MVVVPIEFWLLSLAAFGAIFGSFINMAAYRLPRNISTVTRTRSFCPSCEHQLAWYDNVPLLSYLSLLGRCRYCRKPIGVRYFLVEVIVTTLFVLAGYQFFVLNPPLTWNPFTGTMPPIIFAVQLFLIADLVLLAVVDIEAWLIPIHTTLPWAVAGLVLAPIFPDLHASASNWSDSARVNALIDSFTGMVLGAGLLWSIGYLTTVLTFFWARAHNLPDRPKEGMGSGDVHLLAMVGAVLGWKPALLTIFLGIFLGSFSGVSKILWEKFQHWRLRERYRPWQPKFELPEEADADPPSFWPLAVMGVIVWGVVVFLMQQSQDTFDHLMRPTMQELTRYKVAPAFAQPIAFDPRLWPVYLLAGIGVLLITAFPFFQYLKSIDLLPQGSIVEKDSGKKEEVLEGNYIPFGPSLAAAALIVAFYDPLLHEFTFWFFTSGQGWGLHKLPYEVPAGREIGSFLVACAHHFNDFSRWIFGG